MKKFIQIDGEKCTGCGACVQACSYGAIHVVGQHAEIDDTLCTVCEACMDACVNSAIIAISPPVYAKSITTRPVTDFEVDRHQPGMNVPESITPKHDLMPLAGAIFTFLGNEVAPRKIDLLLKSLENRLSRLKTVTGSATTSSASTYPLRKGQGKQIRHRGGNMKNRDHNNVSRYQNHNYGKEA